ncbi:MAG: FAD-dependent oxidoreductase, partial [Planctomycetaceae bacterium]|nr:FAD-dependent oxidoreductase [Planctomycetaceae bacterium]
SGLSIASRLVQSGLPVTLLEATRIGAGASTRNQGWLHSGGWFATQHRSLARECYESLQQTIKFCPECLEPNHDGMAYIVSDRNSDTDCWTESWRAAGIPFSEWDRDDLLRSAPALSKSPIHRVFRLPDGAFRPDILVNHLAAAARNAGVELLTETRVERLLYEGDSVVGIRTGTGEEIAARLVILAGNTGTAFLWPGSDGESVGRQSEFQRVFLRTHLLAVEPEICSLPFCVIDSVGINHIPHQKSSVLGNDHWQVVNRETRPVVSSSESLTLYESVNRFLPTVDLDTQVTKTWAGITVQAMHVTQVEPGQAPLTTVIDHERDAPAVRNLLSVFPGRATLWPQLAEQTREAVLAKLQPQFLMAAQPPWECAAL